MNAVFQFIWGTEDENEETERALEKEAALHGNQGEEEEQKYPDSFAVAAAVADSANTIAIPMAITIHPPPAAAAASSLSTTGVDSNPIRSKRGAGILNWTQEQERRARKLASADAVAPNARPMLVDANNPVRQGLHQLLREMAGAWECQSEQEVLPATDRGRIDRTFFVKRKAEGILADDFDEQVVPLIRRGGFGLGRALERIQSRRCKPVRLYDLLKENDLTVIAQLVTLAVLLGRFPRTIFAIHAHNQATIAVLRWFDAWIARKEASMTDGGDFFDDAYTQMFIKSRPSAAAILKQVHKENADHPQVAQQRRAHLLRLIEDSVHFYSRYKEKDSKAKDKEEEEDTDFARVLRLEWMASKAGRVQLGFDERQLAAIGARQHTRLQFATYITLSRMIDRSRLPVVRDYYSQVANVANESLRRLVQYGCACTY